MERDLSKDKRPALVAKTRELAGTVTRLKWRAGGTESFEVLRSDRNEFEKSVSQHVRLKFQCLPTDVP